MSELSPNASKEVNDAEVVNGIVSVFDAASSMAGRGDVAVRDAKENGIIVRLDSEKKGLGNKVSVGRYSLVERLDDSNPEESVLRFGFVNLKDGKYYTYYPLYGVAEVLQEGEFIPVETTEDLLGEASKGLEHMIERITEYSKFSSLRAN